jgi:hypothetical protein
MTLISPNTGDPIIRKDTNEEAWIELLPSDSEFGAQIDRRIQDKIMRRRVPRMSTKDLDNNILDKLGQLTKSWSLAAPDGSPIEIPCTPENATELYTDVRWLRLQVSAFVNDLGNFQPTLSENSSTTPNGSSSSVD